MNKKVLIISTIFIVVGIVGFIPSSILSIPYFVGLIENAQVNSQAEETIYNKSIDINDLVINTKVSNVEVHSHNENYVIVDKIGNRDNIVYDVKEENEKLIITEKNMPREKISNSIKFNKFVEGLANEMFSYETQKLVIYLPEAANLNVTTYSGDLIVGNNSSIDKEISFKTDYGTITLPREIKSMDKLNISSYGTVHLRLAELLGIKDVNISSRSSINIRTEVEDMFINDSINYIPESINISSDSDIFIDSSMPIGKNVNIVHNYGDVDLNLPIKSYNINLDLSTNSHNIEFVDYEGESKFTQNYKGRLYNVDDVNEYNLIIKSGGYIRVNNVSNQIEEDIH